MPAAVAGLVWWLSTGVVLWLIGRPARTYRFTAAGATALGLGATILAAALRNETGAAAAYLGFGAGLACWAWHEVLFLLGYVAGPRRTPCPEKLPLWRRFLVSAEALQHHEISIALHAGVLVALSFGAENAVAAWTYCLLWGMRLSAKMVVFFGAPNLNAQFLPKHLDYLKSYFGARRSALALPAIAIVSAVAAGLVHMAGSAIPNSFEQTALALLAALAGLAVLEHVALVLPLPDAALFRWAAPAAATKGRASLGEAPLREHHY